MFIKTLDGKKLLNTERITSIEIHEPQYNQKNYLISASMFQDGGIITEAETITAKIYFKVYTISTEEKRSIYKIFQAVKVEYYHNKIDAWSGQKTVLNEFIKTMGTNYAPEDITI